MPFNTVAEKITDMRAQGMKFGTERTRALLDKLGSPDGSLKIVHVSGTNAKGSVCEYLTQILLAAGARTGTYTTPEVFSFYDQFRVCGRQDKALADECLALADEAAEKMEDKPTAYERQTAAAFLMFAKAGCEYAVTECCMGGTLDTTNAVRKKVMAAVTSVSLEHTAFLGDTLQEIAAHKAGIISDCPAVVSRCVPQEVRDVFFARGAVLSLDAEDIAEGEEGTRFTCGGVRYFTHMQGCMQPYNAAVAITAAQMLGIDGASIKAGVARAFAPGRLQICAVGERRYILDGAHNPESFLPLARLLATRYEGRSRTIIYGCLRDKDADSSLAALSGCADRAIAVSPPGYRAMEREKILKACRAAFGNACAADGVSAALDGADGEVVAVCGSFTLLKEAEEWIEKKLSKR